MLLPGTQMKQYNELPGCGPRERRISEHIGMLFQTREEERRLR